MSAARREYFSDDVQLRGANWQLVRAMEALRRPGSELMWAAEAEVGRRFGIEATVEPGLVQ